jgi:hypothetical protein
LCLSFQQWLVFQLLRNSCSTLPPLNLCHSTDTPKGGSWVDNDCVRCWEDGPQGETMIDLVELYAIQRLVALHHEVISCRELSARYRQRTGEQHHGHGTWDAPLGQRNGHTPANGLPAISAVLTYRIDEDDPDSPFGPPRMSSGGRRVCPLARRRPSSANWLDGDRRSGPPGERARASARPRGGAPARRGEP